MFLSFILIIFVGILKKLTIAGVDKCRLKKESYPLLEKLAENRSIQYLNISNNKIGKDGIIY